jgi:quercetin dioxygenase-like cupin family protein
MIRASIAVSEVIMALPVFPVVSPNRGVQRQVLSEAPEMMMVSFRFETGAEGKLHSHPHVQSTYVARGRFRFFRDGATYELAAGDSLVIPGNVEHGCQCIEEGELIDCFTPRRDDFL